MAITAKSSPLTTAANNIVKIGLRSRNSLPRAQSEFESFSKFLTKGRAEIEAIELPSQKKIKELANKNIVSNFGSAGNLLKNLLGGAFDLGNFISGFFPGKGEKIGKTPSKSKPQQKSRIQGNKLKLGGLRALGIVNTVFAGLDFATGLAEGESVGKAGAGAAGSLAGGLVGGALAGSLLSGAAGQALIPVPGLGFLIGAAVGGLGSFLGGYAADRVYEGITGEDVKKKQEEELKKSSQRLKASSKLGSGFGGFDIVIIEFDKAVERFEDLAMNIGNFIGLREDIYGYSEELSEDESPELPSDIDTGPISYGTGNAEFGETGNVSNAEGWVHGHFQGTSPQSVVKDTAIVVNALLKQGSPVYLPQPGGGGIDLLPKKKYTEEEIYKYVENARKAHTHSGTGKSVDVFVKKGTKVPVPLVDIRPTGAGYGGWGRGGNSGYIQGTTTWIGHLTPNSKPGLSVPMGQIRGKISPEVDMVGDNKTTPPSPTQSSPPTPTQQSNTRILTPSSSAPTTTQPRPITQPLPQNVMAAPPREQPKIQSYPSYSQGQSYILERQTIIATGTNSSGQRQAPVVVPVGGGGGSAPAMIINSGASLNSLMKNILLTSLSSS
jgi:hypothetical protein